METTKILVFSDTHGYLENAFDAIQAHPDVDVLLHLGDCQRDFEKIKLACLDGTLEVNNKNILFHNVLGNIDHGVLGNYDYDFMINGKKIFITHGHRYKVKYHDDVIYYKGREVGADIVLFGHTHIPYEAEYNGMLLMNPGSISLPRGGQTPSYLVLEVSDTNVSSEIIFF